MQIVYGVGGERWLPELTIPWLAGYDRSPPVRIGNAAYQQLQLDVLGEVADAMDDSDVVMRQLGVPRLERAIGVIYRPETERQSHYFQARLPDQFDAVVHFDETFALKPLDTSEAWEAGELPETFPFAV